MKCPLCNKEIPVNKLIEPHTVSQKNGEIEVCGQCFLLVCILETLKEIRDGRSK